MEIKIETGKIQEAVTQFNHAYERFQSEQKHFTSTMSSFGSQKTDFLSKFEEILDALNQRSTVEVNQKMLSMIEKGQTFVSESTHLDIKLGEKIKGGSQ